MRALAICFAFCLTGCGMIAGKAPPITSQELGLPPVINNIQDCGSWSKAQEGQAAKDLQGIPATSPAMKIVEEWEQWRKDAHCPDAS